MSLQYCGDYGLLLFDLLIQRISLVFLRSTSGRAKRVQKSRALPTTRTDGQLARIKGAGQTTPRMCLLSVQLYEETILLPTGEEHY